MIGASVCRRAIPLVLAGTIAVLPGQASSPADLIGTEPFEIESTAYCISGNTANGHPTVEGLTVAGAKEWIGCTVAMYDLDMNFIGYYEVTDTGSDYRLQNGTCIDIYMEDYESCIEWGRKEVIIQLIKSEG